MQNGERERKGKRGNERQIEELEGRPNGKRKKGRIRKGESKRERKSCASSRNGDAI